jgi:hypothetical protein
MAEDRSESASVGAPSAAVQAKPRPALRWGSVAERELVGSSAIVAGALLMVQMNGLALWAGALGAVIHIAGWNVLPHGGARRITAAVLSPIAVLTMLLGPAMAWAVAIPLALWFLVHRVTPRTYLLCTVPVIWAIGVVSSVGMTGPRLIIFGSSFAVACAIGWWGLRRNRISTPENGVDISADS